MANGKDFSLDDLFLSVLSLYLPVKVVEKIEITKKGLFRTRERKYYEIHPDPDSIGDHSWLKHSPMTGVNLNEKKQLEILDHFVTKYKSEYEAFPRDKPSPDYRDYYVNNNRFETVDGEVLYCMVRHFRPGKMIEIGSGFSTLVAAQAIQKNKAEDSSYNCEFIAIEPYPLEFLMKGFPGLTRLIEEKVQDVPLDEFLSLKENDILFIDSTHMLSIGNDVHYEQLEILPKLAKGVVAHIHDIFVPAEFPRYLMEKHFLFFTEQYLFQAFMSFNDSFEVLWAGSYLCLNHPEKIEAAFSSYRREIGMRPSFWIRRVK